MERERESVCVFVVLYVLYSCCVNLAHAVWHCARIARGLSSTKAEVILSSEPFVSSNAGDGEYRAGAWSVLGIHYPLGDYPTRSQLSSAPSSSVVRRCQTAWTVKAPLPLPLPHPPFAHLPFVRHSTALFPHLVS